MPLLETKGAGSAQGFGEFTASAAKNYIEDVFSTYLYTGTGTAAGSTQTITNGIDLAGKGGMVWIKDRAIKDHFLFDTNRGPWKYLRSNTTDAQPGVNEDALSAFNSNGFTLTGDNNVTQNGQNYVSWTFREQPKFFDVVTYTGDGVAGRQIAHNLGSAPGCIIIKNYSGTDAGLRGWGVWHRTLAEDYHLTLNSTAAQTLNTSFPLFGKPAQQTSTYFTVGQSDATGVNAQTNGAGLLYVAYLFAHNAGGFGLTGTDNVISCGSYTGTGATQNISLGYEPQWIMIKPVNLSGPNWLMFDTMRGWNNSTDDFYLAANSAAAEANYRTSISGDDLGEPTATGFKLISTSGAVNASGEQYIYIAIRRGPMKVPTSGTSVFQPVTYTGNGAANRLITSGIVTDFVMARPRDYTGNGGSYLFTPRLIGGNFLESATTNSETAAGTVFQTPTSGFGNSFSSMVGFGVGSNATYELNRSSALESALCLQRATGFMDVCCYTGTGSARTVTHNLAAVPELMIVKSRSVTGSNWLVYNSTIGPTNSLYLNLTTASDPNSFVNNTAPTSSVFSLGTSSYANGSGSTYVAYLFATCAGVSKVGSYTGTGTTQQINCGFSGGARFVLIKRTDSTGGWYVWDSARGIVAGNDPYLLFNSGSAEVTSTDYVDTYSAGFEISSTAPAAINASGGTFIFLAIA